MDIRPIVLCVLGTLFGSCGSGQDPDLEQAAAQFGAFQDALFERDATTLRSVLCRDARPAVEGLLAANLEDRPRLEVESVTRRNHEFRVYVREAAADKSAEKPFYVLTKEDGAMRVDLLSTTLYQSKTRRTKLAKPTFIPGKLR